MIVAPEKTAWIIGASSGLGAALATRLVNEGYQVAISARRAERLQEMVSRQPKMHAFAFDVADHDATTACAKEILDRFGHLDLVVFCAVHGGERLGFHDRASKGMAIGLLGATAALEPTLSSMKERKSGHIAFIGSPVGFRALPGTGSYGVTKSALHYLAEQLKIELSIYSIDVQLILPGFVDTELTQKNEFPMPFLMSVDEATDRIMRGMRKPSRFRVAFPRRLMWPMRLLGMLPDNLYHWVMSKLVKSVDKQQPRN